MILHAGLLARRLDGLWRGALIRGPSGAGKSDLFLRALESGAWRMAADDRVLAWRSAGRLFGRAPDSLRDLIEARGLGIEREEPLAFCEIVIVVDCIADGRLERLPEPETVEVLGETLPLVGLAALEPSAPAKLRRALERLGGGRDES